MVYPVSRSSIIFLPVLAYFFIGETVDTIGIIAIVLIILGTFVMHLDSFDKKGVRSILVKYWKQGKRICPLGRTSRGRLYPLGQGFR